VDSSEKESRKNLDGQSSNGWNAKRWEGKQSSGVVDNKSGPAGAQ